MSQPFAPSMVQGSSRYEHTPSGGRVAGRAGLAALARARDGVVHREQAHACGVTDRMLAGMVARGELVRVHRNVLRSASVAWGARGRIRAALAAAGPEAAASHSSAAWLLGIDGAPAGRPEIVVPFGVLPVLDGVRVHRSRQLPDCDTTEVDGMRSTTGSRTLIDLGSRGGRTRTIARIDDALCAGAATRTHLFERAWALRRGRAGVGPILEVTHPDAEGTFWSALERAFAGGVRAHRLPPPEYNAPLHQRGHRLVLDALWPDASLVVELHGLRFHSAPVARGRDDERFNLIVEAGLRPLVFTWQQVLDDFGAVAATIRRALALDAAT